MNGLDYLLLAILFLSAVLGVWRGMVYEVLSLAGWVIAYVVARHFAAAASAWVPAAITAEVARVALAYAAVFVLTLLACAISAWLLSRLIRLAGLGLLDRVLGGLFGLVRGGLIVLVLAWLAGLTDLPQQPFWREAALSARLQEAALFSKAALPHDIAQKITY